MEPWKSFIVECEALRNIKHRNLFKVLTVCSGVDLQGNDFKALVYEFMANGSLEDWLHSKDSTLVETKSLNLLQRLNIAIDIVYAVAYHHLHHEISIIDIRFWGCSLCFPKILGFKRRL